MGDIRATCRVLGWHDVRVHSQLGVPLFIEMTYTQHSLVQAILFLIFGRSDLFINVLGFLALGLESTLPIPQFLRYV